MARSRWVARMVDGQFQLIPAEEYAPSIRTQILTDAIKPTWHPVTGEYCSSRTKMVKIAKAHGLEECGSEPMSSSRRQEHDTSGIREAVIEATRNVRY